MSNTVALGLAAVIGAALALDALLLDSAGLVFAGRTLVSLIETLAFWR